MPCRCPPGGGQGYEAEPIGRKVDNSQVTIMAKEMKHNWEFAKRFCKGTAANKTINSIAEFVTSHVGVSITVGW
jgi:hypothetical protein